MVRSLILLSAALLGGGLLGGGCDSAPLEAPPDPAPNATYQLNGVETEGYAARGVGARSDIVALSKGNDFRAYGVELHFERFEPGTYDMSWSDPDRGVRAGVTMSERLQDAITGSYVLDRGSAENVVRVAETEYGFEVRFSLDLVVTEPRQEGLDYGNVLPDSVSFREGLIRLRCDEAGCGP